ncbi:MAG: hypothetical protein N2606_03690 [Candidatus Omnitrophica bacterium]|nr:hypothetical protein [Candidatus Omnitrophota bacterium]
MNWWLDLGRIYYNELTNEEEDWEAIAGKITEKIEEYQSKFESEIEQKIKKIEEENKNTGGKTNNKKMTGKGVEIEERDKKKQEKIKNLSKKKERLDACRNLISKTLLNNPIFNKGPHGFENSKKRLKNFLESNEAENNEAKSSKANCVFCGNETVTSKESLATRAWIVSGGWENSSLYAAGGRLPPRICLNCRKLSLLAAFKAYDLFFKNGLPFIIYNADLSLFKKLLDNLVLRKDINLNFEKVSATFISLGSTLVYPRFDNQGNIESFDLRPLLPKESLLLMKLAGIIRNDKRKERYILDLVARYKNRLAEKLVIDFLSRQSPLQKAEVISVFFSFLEAYKGGVNMTDFFKLGEELGKALEDKAYSVALKLYKSFKEPIQFQQYLIGAYIYLKRPVPQELVQITKTSDNSLAFIMGILSTVKKEVK